VPNRASHAGRSKRAFRSELFSPALALIVATDGQIYYYDSKLQQVSRTYVTDTPAWFLLRDPITLNGDITLTGFKRQADTLRLTITKTSGEPNYHAEVFGLFVTMAGSDKQGQTFGLTGD